MTRPLAAAGFSLLASLIVYANVDLRAGVYLLAALLVCCGVFSMVRRDMRAAAFTVALSCCAGFVLCLAADAEYGRIVAFEGRNRSVEGIVYESPKEYYGSERFVVSMTSVDSMPAKGRIYCVCDFAPEMSPGDFVTLDGVSLSRTGSGSPAALTAARAKGIYLSAYKNHGSAITVRPNGDKPLITRFTALREMITGRIAELWDPDTAPLLSGMLTGDTSCVDTGTADVYRLAGFAHVFAVSGFHLSVWTTALTLFTGKSVKRRYLRNILILVFVAAFCAVTGFSASVVRAGIMTGFICVGRMLFKRPDPMNSLGASLIPMLIVRPYAALGASLLLSVGATAGIALLYEPLCEFVFERLPERIRKEKPDSDRVKKVRNAFAPLTISLCTMVFVVPLSAYLFGYSSLVSPLTNILASVPAELAIVIGAAGAALGGIPLLGTALVWSSGLLVRLVTLICRMTSGITGSVIGLGFRGIKTGLALIFIITAAVCIFAPRPGKMLRRTIIPAVVCAAVLIAVCTFIGRSSVTVEPVGTSNATCVLVETPSGTSLIGCGGRASVVGTLIPRDAPTENGQLAALEKTLPPAASVNCFEDPSGSLRLGETVVTWSADPAGAYVFVSAPRGVTAVCALPSADAREHVDGQLIKLISRSVAPPGAEEVVAPDGDIVVCGRKG